MSTWETGLDGVSSLQQCLGTCLGGPVTWDKFCHLHRLRFPRQKPEAGRTTWQGSHGGTASKCSRGCSPGVDKVPGFHCCSLCHGTGTAPQLLWRRRVPTARNDAWTTVAQGENTHIFVRPRIPRTGACAGKLSPRGCGRQVWCRDVLLPGSQTAVTSHGRQQKEASSPGTLTRTPSPSQARDLSKPKPSRMPSPNTTTLRGRISAHEFGRGGGRHSDPNSMHTENPLNSIPQ